MKILVAEDEQGISKTYQIMLEDKGHEVTLTSDGAECVIVYGKALSKLADASEKYVASHPPFDAVILDYRMPKMDGMEAAKAILEINPYQRIIFASAYVATTILESVKQLGVVVELLQKPFDLEVMVEIVEDKSVYEELKKINVNVKAIKELNPTHEQIRDLLQGLKKMHLNTPLIDCR
jgi:CheY-like chemotaxis protein